MYVSLLLADEFQVENKQLPLLLKELGLPVLWYELEQLRILLLNLTRLHC